MAIEFPKPIFFLFIWHRRFCGPNLNFDAHGASTPLEGTPPPPILDVPNALKKEFRKSETVGRLCEADKWADSGYLQSQAASCTAQVIETHMPHVCTYMPIYAYICPHVCSYGPPYAHYCLH